ncbi:MAG: hypothetical protein WCA81_14115 [Rhizomicrobium sp.]
MWNMIFTPLLNWLPYIGGAFAATLVIYWIRENWEDVSFMLLRMWYAFPLIGKARSLAGDLTEDQETNWFVSELKLCNDFHSHLVRSIEDPDLFDKAKNYLAKVGELGRTPAQLWGFILIPLLVFVEALGFAYVLAGYTLPGSSEALQVPGAVAIALLISIGLVFLTHMAGKEWHWRNLMEGIRVMYINDKPELRVGLIGHLKVSLDKTMSDEPERTYVQRLKRIETNARVTTGVSGWSLAMVGVIILVTVGAFYVRYQTLMNIESCIALNQGPQPTTEFFADPTNNTLPPDITKPDEANRANGEVGACNAKEKASIATYVVLGVVFVVVQLIGWTFGYRYGFAGIDSYDAWKLTHRFSSQVKYQNWRAQKGKHICEVAQQHLSQLQRLLLLHAQSRGVDADVLNKAQNAGMRRFDLFLERLRQKPVMTTV